MGVQQSLYGGERKDKGLRSTVYGLRSTLNRIPYTLPLIPLFTDPRVPIGLGFQKGNMLHN
jgi:hypothetical protein